MAVPTRVSGRTTTWKEWVFTSGTTVGNTKDSTRTIRSMDSECTLGLMVVHMKVTGGRVSSMALVLM